MTDNYWTKSDGEIVNHDYLVERARKLRPGRLIASKGAIIEQLRDPTFMNLTNGMLVSAAIREAESRAFRSEASA